MTWSLGAGLEGRGVVVTGAAGGIGAAIVRAFATTGARVAAVDLETEGIPECDLALAANLRDLDAHAPLLERVRTEFGRLDVLVHAAAVLRRQANVDDVTPEDWALQDEVNLRATFFLDRAAARVMREQGEGGRIVNFASQGWWTGGFGGSVVYAATKGGIVSLTRGLARTYGPDGITVNCIAPGAVDTPMLHDGFDRDAYEAFVAQIPLGRIAQPEEIAGAAVFLASSHAAYITGATLNLSGGQLMY